MEKIKIPKDMDDAKALGTVLSKYKDTYYTQVLVAYFATYVLYPWRKHMHLLEKSISTLLTKPCQAASCPSETAHRQLEVMSAILHVSAKSVGSESAETTHDKEILDPNHGSSYVKKCV